MATRRTVLIVDDETSILLSLQRIFELSGDFEVLTARNVDEAWQIINKIIPDLIISDIAMPDIDGIEFCKMVRNHELTRNLPFIFLTAKSERLIEGFKAGGDDFILKPFNLDEVMAKIEAIFRRLKNTRELVTQLKGNLSDYSVDEILQLCNDKSITGTIILYNKGETGKIVLERGDIKDIIYADLSPTKALDILRLWNSGFFIIRPDDFGLRPDLIKKRPRTLPKPELNEAIPITDQVWWVGYRDIENRMQYNSYLRVFEKEKDRINFLIDPGGQNGFEAHKNKLLPLIGSLVNLQVMSVSTSLPQFFNNVKTFHEENSKLIYVTNNDILQFLQLFGINERQVKRIDILKDQTLKLVTNHKLRFIPVPYCPQRYSFMIYDEQSRILFSGLLFGSYVDLKQSNRLYAIEEDWEAVRQFQLHWMPTGNCLKFAVQEIRKLHPSPVIVAPMVGMIWRGIIVDQFLERLLNLETGIDLQLNPYNYEQVNNVIQACNRLLEHVEQLFTWSWIEGKIMQDAWLMARCAIVEGQIQKIYGNPTGCFDRLTSILIQGEEETIAGQILSFAKNVAQEFHLNEFIEPPMNGQKIKEFFQNG